MKTKVKNIIKHKSTYSVKKKYANILKSNKFFLISMLAHIFLCVSIFINFNLVDTNKNIISTKNSINTTLMYYQEKKIKKHKINKNTLLEKEDIYEEENKELNDSADAKEIIADSRYIKDIEYSIKRSVNPKYPKIARRMPPTNILVKTRILVDKDGKIEKIDFIEQEDSNKNIIAFQKEVSSALTYWEFSPIKVDNKPVKVYFYKDFNFKIRG